MLAHIHSFRLELGFSAGPAKDDGLGTDKVHTFP